MGMFDWYAPQPPLNCPRCGAELARWQGKDGPCLLFEWLQGQAEPRDQHVDEGFAVAVDQRGAILLPRQFEIYTSCDACTLWVDASCFCERDAWTFTDLYLDTDHHGLPEDWGPLPRHDREAIVTELRRELCPGHVLYGLPLAPMARSKIIDAVLVRAYGAPSPLYLVHLTWRAETSTLLPSADPYRDFAEFKAAMG